MRRLYGINQQLASNNVSLVEARASAEAADKAKTLLLRNMDSDIQIPLNVIAEYSQRIATLSGEMSHDEKRRHFGVIQENTSKLLELIGDALEKAQK